MVKVHATDPPTMVSDLREISSVTVAIAIWNHFNFNTVGRTLATWRHTAKDGTDWSAITSKVNTSTMELPLPKSILDNISLYSNRIRFQIEKWVAYHFKSIFFQTGADNNLYCHIPYISWYSNGFINYKQTARNLLSSVRLSLVEKYKFLSVCCLKDEMEEIKAQAPLLFSDTFMELVEFTSNPLIYYWNCYFRNELDKIPVPENASSLDSFMFQYASVDNWPAKEYFFDRLSSGDKILGAIALIDQHAVRYQKIVLLKLNEFERTSVYMERAVQIMGNYARTEVNYGNILATWLDIRNVINLDQFVAIFKALLRVRKADAILSEIWANTSRDFKDHLLNYNDHEVLGDIFNLNTNSTGTGGDFLFVVLSELDAGIKRKITKKPFFSSYCDKLLTKEKLPQFDRFVRGFVPSQEVEQCKENLIIRSAYVKEECLCFYSTAQTNEADNFLRMLLPSNPDLIQAYKINLIRSREGIEKCVDRMDLAEPRLDQIMKACLPSEELIAQFKRTLIFSPLTIQLFQSGLGMNHFADVKRYVESYLTSSEDKKTIKKRLLVDFEDHLLKIFLNYDVISWPSIQEWCLESEEDLREFKSSLRVDGLFDDFLINAVFISYDYFSNRLSSCVFRKEVEFEPLNRFLGWYFENESKVKEYKLRRINSYSDISMINTLLKKKDDWYLKLVMKWFFDDNRAEIENFKQRHVGKKIIRSV